jgi:hypothetical protein
MAAQKRSRAGAPSKVILPSLVASKRHPTVSSAASMAQPSGNPLQSTAAKRKTDELSSSDGSSGPGTRRPAPNPLDGLSAPGTSGEAAASCKPLPDKDGPAYAAVFAGYANPQQSGGLPKPSDKGAGTSEPAVSSGAASRRMSTDMSGPLDGMPAGTTSTDKVALACKRPNKTPIFVSGVSDTRGSRTCLRTQCPNILSALLKAEKLMIVPGTANGFRATMSALRSLNGSKGVSFHTFSLPEDREVRLLTKNLGRQMPESVVREELESLGMCVQGVIKLRSRRSDLDASKVRRLTPHFIVLVAPGPGVK